MHGEVGRVGDARDDYGRALADHVERVRDDLLVNPDDADGLVGALTPGQFLDHGRGLLGGGEDMGRAELERGLALERHRVHADDVLGAGVHRALHGVHPDPAEPVDDAVSPGRTPPALTALP